MNIIYLHVKNLFTNECGIHIKVIYVFTTNIVEESNFASKCGGLYKVKSKRRVNSHIHGPTRWVWTWA